MALNAKGLIFGKNLPAADGLIRLRAPSVGKWLFSQIQVSPNIGTPLSNEWDKILDKDSGYI